MMMATLKLQQRVRHAASGSRLLKARPVAAVAMEVLSCHEQLERRLE